MKKRMKKFFACMLAFALTLGVAMPMQVSAAEESTETYDVFLAIGADAAESNDWGYGYAGPGSDVTGDIKATDAKIAVGETATVSLEFASPVVYTWYLAPVIAATNVVEADFDVKVLIDGKDVTDTINFAADEKNWWAEDTGAFTAANGNQAIRLAGGYNEWGTKYMAESPSGFTKIEYVITANSIKVGEPVAEGAAVESTEEYDVFIALGGDAVESNDWGYGYYGEGTDVTGAVTATNGKITSGGTTTVSLEFAEPVLYTWFVAPTIGNAQNVTSADFDIQVLIDGKDVTDTIDFAAGDAWWLENTGVYTDADGNQSMRLAGGYNEWGTKYMAESPAGFTKIEYVITANSIMVGGSSAASQSTESYDMFIAMGGDAAESNDWALNYCGEAEAPEGITATNAKIAVGETATVSLEFANPVVYTWFMAPTLANAQNVVEADFDVQVLIDGKDVTDTIDFAAGDAWWLEDTGIYTAAAGNQALRIAGGYNEWGTKYMAESPAGFTKIEYVITANSIMVGAPEEAPAQPEYDANGVYHAYFGVQTPTWLFRNAHDDATYGKDSGCFDQMGFVDGEWVAQGGQFTDVEIAGNGTYTVGMSGFDFSGTFQEQAILGEEGLFNLLFVSTDLPNNDGIVISNVTLKMDGKEITTQESAFLDPDAKDVKKVLLANIWNNEIPALPYYAAPTDSIEITFTVSGFDYDAAPAEVEATPATEEVKEEAKEEATVAATAEATAAAVEEAPASSSNTGVIIIVVVIVAVVAVAAGVIVSKKKKEK